MADKLIEQTEQIEHVPEQPEQPVQPEQVLDDTDSLTTTPEGAMDLLNIMTEKLEGKVALMLATLKKSIQAEIDEYHDQVEGLMAALAEYVNPEDQPRVEDIQQELAGSVAGYDGSFKVVDLTTTLIVMGGESRIRVEDNNRNIRYYPCLGPNRLTENVIESRVQTLRARGVSEDKLDEMAHVEMEHVHAISYWADKYGRHGAIFCNGSTPGVKTWQWVRNKIVHMV